MKISLGPILSFRGVTTAGWSLSALIVTDILSNPPELILQTGNRPGRRQNSKMCLAKDFPSASHRNYPRSDSTAGRCDSIAPPNCGKLPPN